MLKEVAERLKNVKVSASAAMTRKVRELRAQGVKIVGLSSGEPDFPTPPHAIEAAHKAALAGDTTYPPQDGVKPLKHSPMPGNPYEDMFGAKDVTFIAPHPPMPADRVRFVGEAVAMVVAYTPAADSTWYWTAARGWLEVAPGAAAFAGGLLLLGSTNRAVAIAGSWLGIAGGAWLIVGPSLTDVLNMNIGTPDPTLSTRRQALAELAYFYAVGALILFFAAAALGRLSVQSLRDVTIAERRVAQAEIVADSAPAAEDAHVAPAVDATATVAAPTVATPTVAAATVAAPTLAAATVAAATVAAADADAEPATPLPSHSTYSPIEISDE